mmetsp:Transcript_21086/g.71889  ORF Transcript_21086/g.71889 Transcript_21086/m.71889 type:complete len:205 (+) Transcript_21086:493-1107(+)
MWYFWNATRFSEASSPSMPCRRAFISSQPSACSVRSSGCDSRYDSLASCERRDAQYSSITPRYSLQNSSYSIFSHGASVLHAEPMRVFSCDTWQYSSALYLRSRSSCASSASFAALASSALRARASTSAMAPPSAPLTFIASSCARSFSAASIAAFVSRSLDRRSISFTSWLSRLMRRSVCSSMNLAPGWSSSSSLSSSLSHLE